MSAVPMAVIPFLSTAAVYEAFVHDPLFSGKNLFIYFFSKSFAFFVTQCSTSGAFSPCRPMLLNCSDLKKPQFVKQTLKNRMHWTAVSRQSGVGKEIDMFLCISKKNILQIIFVGFF